MCIGDLWRSWGQPQEVCPHREDQETVRKMLEHPGGHVTDYMDDMGYSDQAHFQREFKWYTGMTPGSLLKILGDRAER